MRAVFLIVKLGLVIFLNKGTKDDYVCNKEPIF